MADATMPNTSPGDEFFALATSHLADDLDAIGVTRLFQMLAESESCRDAFVEFSWQSRLMSASLVPALELGLDAESDDSPTVTPVSALAANSPVLGFLAGVARTAANSPLVSTLFVALLVYGTFGLLAWNLRSDKLPDKVDSSWSVAFVGESVDVLWPPQTTIKSSNTPLRRGELLKIDAGLLELQLDRGAKVVVEGPAEWTIDDDNMVSLNHGKLTASVPESAIGFAVRTATATVVDLGTEFAVEADESGAIEVQVFKGKTQILLVEKPSASAPRNAPITLETGAARRIEPAGAGGIPVVTEVPAKPQRFVRGLDPTASRRIPVGGALASSEGLVVRSVNYLVNGAGLKGEGHSSMPDYTMWHSAHGKVKNEYVLFDLARAYRLDSMRVWNYNEHDGANEGYKHRGVARANIYTSNSSNGTPLDHPDDWQRVAEDVEFEPADGSPNYSTPQEVPLGGKTARFVAIVIGARTGPEAVGDKIKNQCVGLSEVQFFGDRVQLKQRSSNP